MNPSVPRWKYAWLGLAIGLAIILLFIMRSVIAGWQRKGPGVLSTIPTNTTTNAYKTSKSTQMPRIANEGSTPTSTPTTAPTRTPTMIPTTTPNLTSTPSFISGYFALIIWQGDRKTVNIFDIDSRSMYSVWDSSEELLLAPAWSPDGRYLAFEQWGEVIVVNRKGNQVPRLGWCQSPSWSPDGERIICYHVSRPREFLI